MKYYDNEVLVENVTSNGDYPSYPVMISGYKSIALYGTFDTATVQIVFYSEDSTGTLRELPISTDLTFTAAEAPSKYHFPDGMPVKVRVTSAGAGTNVSINLHDFEE